MVQELKRKCSFYMSNVIRFLEWLKYTIMKITENALNIQKGGNTFN